MVRDAEFLVPDEGLRVPDEDLPVPERGEQRGGEQSGAGTGGAPGGGGRALQAIAVGSRDPALADAAAYNPMLAVELPLLLESLPPAAG